MITRKEYTKVEYLSKHKIAYDKYHVIDFKLFGFLLLYRSKTKIY